MLGHQFEEDETKKPGISDICSTMSVLRRVGWGLGWFGGGSNMDRVCGESQSVPTICSKTCLPSIDRVCSVQLLWRWKFSSSRRQFVVLTLTLTYNHILYPYFNQMAFMQFKAFLLVHQELFLQKFPKFCTHVYCPNTLYLL